MKIEKTYGLVLFMLLVPAVLAGFGCAKKTGMQRAEMTTTSMQTVQNDYQHAAAQIDATNASLNNVLNSATPAQLKDAFETYKSNVAKMDDVRKTLNKDTEKMASEGNAYFAEWGQQGEQYTNPNIQKLSEERRAHLRQTFNQIPAASAGVQGSLNNYVSRLNQIQTYLSNDPTPKGIGAISSIAQNTINDGSNLKDSFKTVQTAINEARAEMMAGGEAAGGEGAGGGQSMPAPTSSGTGTTSL